ncbi:hypothetical protein GQ457_15G018510 [Hibiscus cannabinus]
MAARQSLVRPLRRRCWLLWGGSWLWFPSPVPLWYFFQGSSGRGLLLTLVRLWVFVCALDVILVRPFAEAYPRIVLPLRLCSCGSFHPFSTWCGMHNLPCTRACHGVFHRPSWPCYFVICEALASHRGSPRNWWVLWHAVRVSFASLLHYCVTLGSWCKVVRHDPGTFYVPWWLPHPGVRCQGPLSWLAHAARTYGLGSFDPCPGWGYSAQTWFSFPVTWCASFRPRIDLCTWWVLRCLSSKSPCRFLMYDLSCTRACHGVIHRPPWLCRGVVGKVLASHRGLSRVWWVTLGLCATHDPWLVVWISLSLWMHFRAALGSWCTVVRCEPGVLCPLVAPTPRGARPRPSALASACRSRLWPWEVWSLPWLGLLGPTVAYPPRYLVCKLPSSGRFVGFALLVTQVSLLFPSPTPTKSPCSWFL